MESKERRGDKESEGSDELSKVSFVRGCRAPCSTRLESSKVPSLEGGAVRLGSLEGPGVTCRLPSLLSFFLGGSCPC